MFTRRLSLCLSACLSVCLYVCLLAILRQNYWSDLHENFTKDVSTLCLKKFTLLSERVVARPSVVCLSVCLSSVCNVRAPYSGDWNLRQCFYVFDTLAICWHPGKILRRSSQGNPSVGGVKTPLRTTSANSAQTQLQQQISQKMILLVQHIVQVSLCCEVIMVFASVAHCGCQFLIELASKSVGSVCSSSHRFLFRVNIDGCAMSIFFSCLQQETHQEMR